MTYIKAELRRFVIARAGNCCEYCLISQGDDDFSFHIDHIIAEKHTGQTEEHNLCLSCHICNAYKGSDLTSIDPETSRVVSLFNPRTQIWTDHFRLNDAQIEPLSSEGRVTVSLLRLNSHERVAERVILIQLKRYPCGNL